MVSAAVALLALVVSLILASCGTGPAGNSASPFTGKPVTSVNRVLAVKIDNIAQARPPTGLTKADIVYVLPVEGGLSRILAIVLLPYIHRNARIVDLYAGIAGGYYRDTSRAAPYNLYAHTRRLLAQSGDASKAHDIGSRPPYAESTGSGTAVVLRNGRAYQARWSRPDADGGTTFTTADGRPMTFARGPVWVVLTSR